MDILRSAAQYKNVRNGFISDILFIFLALTVLILPFHKTFPFFTYSIAMIAGLVNIILNPRNSLRTIKPQFLAAGMFLIFIYAFFISSDRSLAAGDLEGKMYILLAPLIFGCSVYFNKIIVNTLIALFAFSCFVMSIVCIAIALYTYAVFHQNIFYYKDLLQFTNMHPAYLGLYISFSVACICIYIIGAYDKLRPAGKILLVCLVLWLSFFLLMLAAKTAIISEILFLNAAFIYWGRKYIGLKKTLAVFLLLNVMAAIVLLSLDTTRERFRLLFMDHETSYKSSVDSRRDIWHAIFNNTDAFWLTGTGSGDAITTLVDFYDKEGFEKGVTERYNAHNQFLEIWVMSGIAGLLIFIFIFIYLLRYAIYHGSAIYCIFLLMFIVNSLTESMLETQSGTIFFSLFNTLFISALLITDRKARHH